MIEKTSLFANISKNFPKFLISFFEVIVSIHETEKKNSKNEWRNDTGVVPWDGLPSASPSLLPRRHTRPSGRTLSCSALPPVHSGTTWGNHNPEFLLRHHRSPSRSGKPAAFCPFRQTVSLDTNTTNSHFNSLLAGNMIKFPFDSYFVIFSF